MAISARTRKLVWGRSGNRCAICRHELVKKKTARDRESIVGDECHIVSEAPGGPRFDPAFPREQIDEYANLLLLCRVHHKMVDDQQASYSADKLRSVKAEHEDWVQKRLAADEQQEPMRLRSIPDEVPKSLRRISSGTELFEVVSEAYAYSFAHDEPRTDDEFDIVSAFLQNAQDWGELDLHDVGERMRASRALGECLKDLESAGFWAFGCRERQVLEGGVGGPSNWPVAHLRVVRDTNPDIVRVDETVGER